MKQVVTAINLMFVAIFSLPASADVEQTLAEMSAVTQQQQQQIQMQQGQYQQQQEEQERYREQHQQYTPAVPPPVYYSAFAVDPESRKYGGAWNYTDSSSALAAAEDSCAQESHSNQCVSRWTRDRFIAVAISTDNRIVRMATSNSFPEADETAIKDCSKAGGNDCETVLVLDNTTGPVELKWGALAYDPDTQKMAAVRNHYTRVKALAAVEQSCNSKNCWTIAFQQRYAAMAVGPDKKVSYATSNISMNDAENEAQKVCHRLSNSKTCPVVVKGTASGE